MYRLYAVEYSGELVLPKVSFITVSYHALSRLRPESISASKISKLFLKGSISYNTSIM
jgi:hypothetical protein